MITPAEASVWLEANARTCGRFELLISAEGCAKMAAEYPLRCEGCERVAELTPIKPRPDARGRYRMIPTIHKQKQRLGGKHRADQFKGDGRG